MTNTSLEKWFGVEDATKETIIDKFKKSTFNKRRWKI
jgi:hypothetical protein